MKSVTTARDALIIGL